MPVFTQTYQPWTGKTRGRLHRTWAIYASSFRLVWRGLLVKIFLNFLFVLAFFWMGLLLLFAPAQVPFAFTLGNRIYRDGFFALPVFHHLVMVVAAVAGGGLISRDRTHN